MAEMDTLERFFKEKLARLYDVPVDAVDDAFLTKVEREVEQNAQEPRVKPYVGGYLMHTSFKRFLTRTEVENRRREVEQIVGV